MRLRLLAAAVALPVGLAASATGAPGPEQPERSRSDTAPQTSDGRPGVIVPPVPRWLRAAPVVTDQVVTPVAPGVTLEQWTQADPPREGVVRAHLLRIDPAAPGVRLDLGSGAHVQQRFAMRRIVTDEGAIAGVNGDFFDIHDTGAPLGNSRDRQRGALGGRSVDWTHTFWIDRDGLAHVGRMPLVGRLRQRPAWRFTHLNSPRILPDAMGVYTPDWGRLRGTSVTDGQTRWVRQVVIRDRRVVSNRRTLTDGRPARGLVLIGRGDSARKLARLRVGSRARMTWGWAARPRVAISGSEVLLRDGLVLASDDAVLHPRTAVGVDRDTGHLLLLVVDGRSAASRGYSLVELATMLRDQGAEDALNLDGGGSSTMVARALDGSLGVVNAPSDGQQRRVPNGLVVYGDPLPPSGVRSP